MPDAPTPAPVPTDGTTPVTLPTQDACCQSPCDPAWITRPSCLTFTETKTSVLILLGGQPATGDFVRGLVTVNVTYGRGAQNFVPSVRFQQENLSTEIYIRGVGSTLDFPQIDPPTSFNLNGVYIPREATSVPLYDVEQLEVLPGPQGTLYGRNTLGGAVNVNFKRPSRVNETTFLTEVGDYSLAHLSAAQNVVVSPEWSARLAVDYMDHAGYQSSGADSQNDLGTRLSVLYDRNDAVTVYLWGSAVTKAVARPRS